MKAQTARSGIAAVNPAPLLVLPRFTIEERDRRYLAVRQLMEEQGLEALIFPHHTGDWDNYQSDTRYLTQVGGGGAATALVFPLKGDPVVGVREARRIEWWRSAQHWVSDIRAPSQVRWSTFFIEALGEIGIKKRVGVVGLEGVFRDPEGIFPHGEIVPVKHAFPAVEFVNATGLMYGLRKKKSPEELSMMLRAQRCGDAAADALKLHCRPGVTEHALYAELVAATIRAGGELPTMILMSAGQHSWQTQLLPSHRTLQRGDVVIMDAEPKYAGYMAQSVETVSLRPLTRLEAEMYDVASECFERLLSEMRVGRRYAELLDVFQQAAHKGHCRPGRTIGHGLGLGQDGPLIDPGLCGDAVIEASDCIVLKPWITTEEDIMSVRVGTSVAMTAEGAVRLGRSDLKPFVVAD